LRPDRAPPLLWRRASGSFRLPEALASILNRGDADFLITFEPAIPDDIAAFADRKEALRSSFRAPGLENT